MINANAIDAVGLGACPDFGVVLTTCRSRELDLVAQHMDFSALEDMSPAFTHHSVHRTMRSAPWNYHFGS